MLVPLVCSIWAFDALDRLDVVLQALLHGSVAAHRFAHQSACVQLVRRSGKLMAAAFCCAAAVPPNEGMSRRHASDPDSIGDVETPSEAEVHVGETIKPADVESFAFHQQNAGRTRDRCPA